MQLAAARGIPLVFLQNITGFMVGREYEAGGIAKDGAKLVTAVACAEVPKLTVVIGGSLRRGQLRDVRPRLLTARAVDVAERPDLGDGRPRRRRACSRPCGGEMTDEEREAFEHPIVEAYEREGSPYYSTARLWDDGVIDPLDTRKVLALSLDAQHDGGRGRTRPTGCSGCERGRADTRGRGRDRHPEHGRTCATPSTRS